MDLIGFGWILDLNWMDGWKQENFDIYFQTNNCSELFPNYIDINDYIKYEIFLNFITIQKWDIILFFIIIFIHIDINDYIKYEI